MPLQLNARSRESGNPTKETFNKIGLDSGLHESKRKSSDATRREPLVRLVLLD
jgi:hypothetical protein